jgi:hypothetical protein
MRVSSSSCMAAFFLASDYRLSQETAKCKVKVQSACALNTLHLIIRASLEQHYPL